MPLVGDVARHAVEEQRSQREDRGAAGVDELRVQFLQRDFGTRQLRPQGCDRFDRQERIGAGRRVKDGEPVTLVMDDVVEPAIKSVRRARRHDRAVEVEQRRRDAGREAIG